MDFSKFEEMCDRAIEIASLKAHIWNHNCVDEFEYIRHDGEYITVIGTDYCGEMMMEDFPVSYFKLGNKQIAALEEAHYEKKRNTETIRHVGVYIGLKT